MILIENIVYPSPQQMKMVIMGARNSFCSRDKSDSNMVISQDGHDLLVIGENDQELLTRLAKASTAEGKYLRMMHLIFDMTAPLYFWKQFDTYKVGTVSNSESTMHTLAKHPIKREDFSLDVDWVDEDIKKDCIGATLNDLEHYRQMFNESGDKRWWTLLIQMLPESYNQKRTIDINYATVMQIIKQREGHKLPEWQQFIQYMTKIPYYNLIKGYNFHDNPEFLPKRLVVPIEQPIEQPVINKPKPRFEAKVIHPGEPLILDFGD